MAKSVLTPSIFYKQLSSLCSSTKHSRYLIAYSGGLDSHVLLHLFASIAKNRGKNYANIVIRSVYIDHGLQAVSTTWANHCQQTADSLGIEHHSIQLHLDIEDGESIEAVARKARYHALKEYLQRDEVLVTAHHQDDQAETLLLQLLRGAGIDGLAAMPMKRPFSGGYHLRPLLSYSRECLEDYAKTNNLRYVTDPSNSDNRFDRNYLRNEVVPMLKHRWPNMGSILSRSAKLQAEASLLLASYTHDEMAQLMGSKENTISLEAIKKLPYLKQKTVLRHWVKAAGFKVPSAVRLQHIIDDVFNSATDARPLVHWQEAEIRRYRDDVYIMSPLPSLTMSQPIGWDLAQPLSLAGMGISEEFDVLYPDDLGELKSILLEQAIPVTVRLRQGGERIRPQHRQHSISLKHLLQEAGIPPWQRERLPLIYANERLISVPTLAQVDKKDLGT